VAVRVEPARWLRAAVVAAVVAAVSVTAFDLTVSERVVDRAVARENAAATSGALAVPEQFTRGEQRGGLVLAELLYALGVAVIVAGVAILLGRTRSAALRWLALSAAGAWALVVVPALVVPPLPPGATVAASIDARRATYVAAVAIGGLGCAAAAWAWRRACTRAAGVRVLAAAALLAASAIVVVLTLPDDRLVEAVDAALLRDFRLASFASQGLFWVACAAGGGFALRCRERDGAV
jgi:hypothetical protein